MILLRAGPGSNGRRYCGLGVFVSGVAILSLEILSARTLAPAFGSGVTVWGAVLTTVLGVMAIGYSVGGRIGGRTLRPHRVLALCLACASAWVFLIPTYGSQLVVAAGRWGVALGPFASILLLIGGPLLCLSMVTPVAVGASMRDVVDVGKASAISGMYWANGTLGSVVGALSTALILLPSIGLRYSYVVVASLLAMGALGVWALSLRGNVLACTIAGVLGWVGLRTQCPIEFRRGVTLIEARDSMYGRVVVLEDRQNAERLLLIDGTVQSMTAIGALNRAHVPIHRAIIECAGLPSLGERALVLGCGSGTLACALAERGFITTSVEIDPCVLQMGRKYFALGNCAVEVRIRDARIAIEEEVQSGGRFGVVCFDLSGGGSQPWHTQTLESYREVARVVGDGVVVLNLIGFVSPLDVKLQRHIATLRAVFSHVRVMQVRSVAEGALTNVLVIASMHEYRQRLPCEELLVPELNVGLITDDQESGGLEDDAYSAAWHEAVRGWLGEGALAPW